MSLSAKFATVSYVPDIIETRLYRMCFYRTRSIPKTRLLLSGHLYKAPVSNYKSESRRFDCGLVGNSRQILLRCNSIQHRSHIANRYNLAATIYRLDTLSIHAHKTRRHIVRCVNGFVQLHNKTKKQKSLIDWFDVFAVSCNDSVAFFRLKIDFLHIYSEVFNPKYENTKQLLCCCIIVLSQKTYMLLF